MNNNTLLRKLIRKQIQKALKESNSETLYFGNPSSIEQNRQPNELRIQRFDNLDRWKTNAMQLGAVVKDRGDDLIAVFPNQDVLGVFSKTNQVGTLNIEVSKTSY
jgi:hypothetical protein